MYEDKLSDIPSNNPKLTISSSLFMHHFQVMLIQFGFTKRHSSVVGKMYRVTYVRTYIQQQAKTNLERSRHTQVVLVQGMSESASLGSTMPIEICHFKQLFNQYLSVCLSTSRFHQFQFSSNLCNCYQFSLWLYSSVCV